MKDRYLMSIISICAAAFLWALEGIVLMPKLFNLNVGFIVFIVHFIGFLILGTLFFNRFKKIKDFKREDYIYFGLIALFGGAIGTLAIVKALTLVQFSQLSIVVLLQKLQPVFAIILAVIILKEKPKGNFVLWAIIAIAASYTLTFGFALPNLGTGANTLYAAIFALIAAFAFGSGTVFGRKMAAKHDNITVTFYRYAFTSAIMLIYVIALSSLPAFTQVTTKNWFVMILIPLTTGLGAMLLYYHGLKNVSATISTMCELFFPISAVLLDYFVNGTMLSALQLISAVIMVFAITMLSMEK